MIVRKSPEEAMKETSKALCYWYKVKIVRIYDGDTFYCDIDLGMHHHFKHQRIRLARCNTPELKGRDRSKGLKAKDFLQSLIMSPDGEKKILLNTVRDGKEKYGRWLGEVWIMDYESGWRNVNDIMLKSGHAEPLAWEQEAKDENPEENPETDNI